MNQVPVLDALLVCYNWPPVGGAGVGRVLKLAKYLPLHRVRPAVLTVENPSVPVLDSSLERDIPAEMEVIRARTLEPSYAVKGAVWRAEGGPRAGAARLRRLGVALARQLLVPDPQVLWLPAARRALRQRIRRRRPDVVLVSGPPFSQFLLAATARHLGVAVVLDYRDEWSTYRTTYEMMGRTGALVGSRLESWALRRADAVISATPAFRGNLLAKFPFLPPSCVHAITNGFDPDDFPPDLAPPAGDKFVLTYAGTVFKLTSPRGLLDAVRRLHATAPDLARRLEVRFVGRIVDTEASSFEGMEALGVTREPYLPHSAILHRLAASHAVVCLLSDVPGAERILPAKTFELMRLGRPVLTIAPPGELADLVRAVGLGIALAPADEEGITLRLAGWLGEFAKTGEPPAGPTIERLSEFDRRHLAGEFARVFRAAAAARR
jgi:glycosyltransferase involved in cell wall biosynthesis